MSLIALPLALILSVATDAPSPPSSAGEPQTAIREFQPDDLSGRRCRDGNLPTGENPSRQPQLEREPATPNEGQIIYAVDRRIDGCSVIVVKYGLSDTRSLLQRSDGILPAPPLERGK